MGYPEGKLKFVTFFYSTTYIHHMGGRKSKTLINVWSLCSMLYTRLADVGYGTKVVKNLCIIDYVLHLGVT